MTSALYRVRLADGTRRLAWGSVEAGPRSLADPSASLDRVLSERRSFASIGSADERVPADAVVVAPVEGQEVWAAGVTYLRSRDARREETVDATPYDLVYEADRPELFFKAPGWRCVGPGEAIGIRRDSAWNVPEPEIALVLDADLRIVGATIGNDVSSRSIEGENPLYLPQAKIYDAACALGPCIVPIADLPDGLEIRMQVERDGEIVVVDRTTTAQMRRPFDELADWLGRALSFPVGAIVLTGTGVVPEPAFTLRVGDVVRIEVDGIGTLSNPVVEVGEPPRRRDRAAGAD
ncbi:MAG TPA: fumarylacetoacetate hydrolase family protein [Actinomycetota bacterium]|nr:fumarylacetoacetate hydrolase family protein [Actinomycetota bacterium]